MLVVKTPSERPSGTYAAVVAECVSLHAMQPLHRCCQEGQYLGAARGKDSQAECKVISHFTRRLQSSDRNEVVVHDAVGRKKPFKTLSSEVRQPGLMFLGLEKIEEDSLTASIDSSQIN